MIDTIDLLIPMDKLKFFSGAWDLNSRTAQYEKFVKNPSRKDLEKWSYMPRLTGYKRKGLDKSKNVRIEFSVPKLLFLNNLDEVQQSDFSLVIDALQERLRAMRILASRDVLENASVSTVHFSKNILLEDGYTASYIISELNKVNMTKCFDFTRTRYINDGESLYAHSTSHQFVVYDKIADLRKGDKRAIDNEQTKYQKSLTAHINNRSTEVLRFEIRLGNKQKMNKLFEDLGYGKNLSFKEVFNEKLSKKVVVSYWEKLIKERHAGLFSLPFTTKDALRTLFLNDESIKPKQTIYLIGLLALAKDEGGMGALRSILSKKLHGRTWYRFIKDLETASGIVSQNKVRSWVVQIDTKLTEFKPYRHRKAETSLSTDKDLLCKVL